MDISINLSFGLFYVNIVVIEVTENEGIPCESGEVDYLPEEVSVYNVSTHRSHQRESHENHAGHQYTVSIDDGTLDAFPSDDEWISGPYTGYDTYGAVDHRYWTCENCSAEATRKGALTDCC